MSLDHLEPWLEHPALTQLGWALAHFVWQGLLLGGLWTALQFAFHDRPPRWRYRLGCAFLALLAALPVLTWLWLQPAPSPSRDPALAVELAQVTSGPLRSTGMTGVTAASVLGNSRVNQLNAWTDAVAPVLAVGWLAGVAVLTVRLLGGAWRLARLRRRSVPVVAGELWDRFADLRQRFRLSPRVVLHHSAAVGVPTVIGWRHPTVLLPTGSLTTLALKPLTMLLAHELAHVRRRDAWVNLAQVGIETLLFFHPVARWISGCIRNEREHCCDDLAIEACGEPAAYVRALTTMETWRQLHPTFALAATGGSLLARARRILGYEATLRGWRRLLTGVGVSVGLLSVVAALLCWILSPARYEAVVRLMISPEPPIVLASEPTVPGPVPAERIRLLRELVRSRTLLYTVIRKERLDGYRTDQDAVERLARSIDVRQASDQPLLDVRVTFADAQKAARIASTLAAEFLDWLAGQRQESTARALFFLRNQMAGVAGEIAKADEDLQQYRLRTAYVSFSPDQNPVLIGWNRAQNDVADAEARARATASVVASMERHLEHGKPLAAFPPLAADPQLASLQLELARLELELEDPAGATKEPSVEASPLPSRVVRLRRLLDRLAVDHAERLRNEATVAAAIEADQRARLTQWEARMMDWQQASIEYDPLHRHAQAKRALHAQLLARLNEIEILQKVRAPGVVVVDPAMTPESPVHPLRKLAVLLFAVGGVATLTGLAFASAPPEPGRPLPA
jgi:uncharacterized protein involved in exopolysaccharide biosynthesis